MGYYFRVTFRMRIHGTYAAPALLLALCLAPARGEAWGGATHRHIAAAACAALGCAGCAAEVADGATAPDRVFKDFINHHCYEAAWACPADESYACPLKEDCPAKKKAAAWIEKAKGEKGCARAYSLAVASHYFSDARVIWHKVQKESAACHKELEREVDDAVAKGEKGWTAAACGQTAAAADIDAVVKDFVAAASPPKEGQAAGGSARLDRILDGERAPYVAAAAVAAAVVVLAVMAGVVRKKRKRR